MSGPTTEDVSDPVGTLKRVKAAEAQWEETLANARHTAEAAIQRMRVETEVVVKAALAEAQEARAIAVESAKAQGRGEADAIEAQGATEAQAITDSEAALPPARRAAVVKAVLGEFLPD